MATVVVLLLLWLQDIVATTFHKTLLIKVPPFLIAHHVAKVLMTAHQVNSSTLLPYQFMTCVVASPEWFHFYIDEYQQKSRTETCPQTPYHID